MPDGWRIRYSADVFSHVMPTKEAALDQACWDLRQVSAGRAPLQIEGPTGEIVPLGEIEAYFNANKGRYA